MNKRISLVITTSYKFDFLVDQCITLSKQALNNNLLDIHIITDRINNYQKKDDLVKIYIYNSDWSTRIKKTLNQIDNENILLITEDTFIFSENLENFNFCFDFFLNNKYCLYLRLHSLKNHYQNLKKINELPPLAPYRFAGPGFWKKIALFNLLLESESPWDFEIMGSYRSRKYKNGFFYPQKCIFKEINVIKKGKYTKQGYDYIKNLDIVGKKNIMKQNLIDYIKNSILKFVFNIVFLIPWRFRVKIMNLLRKALVSY